MNRHRMGARGNALSFLLPWQDLLQQLRIHEGSENGEFVLDLPRTGTELANIV